MNLLGPIITIIGVGIVIVAVIMWSKKKDKRTSRQKHLDQISAIRGDKHKK